MPATSSGEQLNTLFSGTVRFITLEFLPPQATPPYGMVALRSQYTSTNDSSAYGEVGALEVLRYCLASSTLSKNTLSGAFRFGLVFKVVFVTV